MSSEEYEHVHRVFAEVCDLDPADREAALSRACAANTAIRRQVEALLEVDAESRHFLDEPALGGGHGLGAVIGAGHTPELVGKHVAGFLVERVIASGGMGTVYRARQEKPDRTVALKVMRRGLGSGSAARRFEYESQVLARLQHPGIAQVYEVGTFSDGSEAVDLPFFAMELVPGASSLTEYADASGLSTKRRLELFAMVCDAVEHGHRNGVIHRDLKPANILVDSDGQPKIIDFGVAKATDSDLVQTTAQTGIGQLIGTLQYMSPEQCSADPAVLDTRSDVYALGLVLYELLCGRLPYDVSRAAVHEAVRTICDDTPRKPSSVSRLIRGDVETIVLKSLEKDRARRYQSPADLASDIRRFLGDEPITARPPSVLYQMRKFAKRNRALSGGVAATFLALVGGVITTTGQAARASTAEESALNLARTESQLRRNAESARERAEIGEAEARRQTTIATEISTFLQDDLLAAVSPALARGREITVREVFNAAAQRVEGRFLDEPLIEAAISTTLGRMYLQLSDDEAALPLFERAHELRLEALGEENLLTVASMNDKGRALLGVARFDDAENALGEALAKRRVLLGEAHEETRASMLYLGDVLIRKGRYGDALALLSEAGALEAACPLEDETLALKAKTSMSLIHWEQGRLEQAASTQREVYDRLRELYGEDHPDTLSALVSLGASHMMMRDFDQAEELLGRALELAPGVLGENHTDTLIAHNNLLWIQLEQGKFEEVLEPYQDLVGRMAGEHGEEHADTIIMRSNLGAALLGLERFEDALEQLEPALESLRRVSPKHWHEAGHLERYGRALAGVGRTEEARDALYEARDLAVERLGEADGRTLRIRKALLDFLVAEGRDEEAVAEMDELVPLLDAEYGPSFEGISVAMNQYGLLLWKLGRFEEALPVHERAYEIRVDQFGEDDSRTRESMYNIAVQHLELGHMDVAIRMMEELHESNMRVDGNARGFSVYVRGTLAELYNDTGRHSDALEQMAAAIPVAARHPKGAPLHGTLLVHWGVALTGLGRFAEAEEALLEADALHSSVYGEEYERRLPVVQALIELYAEWPDDAKAEHWRNHLDRIEEKNR